MRISLVSAMMMMIGDDGDVKDDDDVDVTMQKLPLQPPIQ